MSEENIKNSDSAPEKEHIQDLAAERRWRGILNPKCRKKVKLCYKTVWNRLWHIWFRFYHPRNQQIYIGRWLWWWYWLPYPAIWTKLFCAGKISNKEHSEIFCWAEPRSGARWLQHPFSEEACWTFCLPEIQDTAVIEPSDTVLKLPQSVVSGSSCRMVTMTFCLDFSGYNVI